MLKRLLKISAWVLGIFILILGLGMGILYFRQDQIRDLVFESINENLNTSIEVKDAGISLRKFPNAAIRLDGVLAAGSNNLGDTLFYVEHLFVEFRVWDMLNDEIPIKSISLEQGQLNLIDQYGLNNWSILKESSGESSAALKLEAIKLNEIAYRFQNESIKLNGYVENLVAAGAFSGANFGLELELQSKAIGLKSGKNSWLSSPIILDSKMDIQGGKEFIIQATELRMGTIENLTAEFISGTKSTLQLKHADLDLEQLKNIYAILGIEWPENFEIEGNSSLRLDLIMAPDTDLRIEAFAQASKLDIQTEDLKFENYQGQLEYYRQGKYDRLEIRGLYNEAKSIAVKGTIRQLLSPQIKLNININEKAKFWNTYLPKGWELSEGQTEIDLDFSGDFENWEALASKAISKAHFDGKLKAQGLQLEIDDEPQFYNLFLQSTLLDQRFLVDSLFLNRGKSDLALKGSLSNVWTYLSDSTSILKGAINLQSQVFLLADFLSESDGEEESSLGMAWKERLDLEGSVHIYDFAFRNFAAKELKGKISLDDALISGEDISLFADEGFYEGRFDLHTPHEGQYLFEAALKAEKVQMSSVFASFDNFDQETITGKNLNGRLSVQARLEAPMSPELQIDIEGLEALAEMTIEEGRLRDYEPMQALSRFAEVEELEDVSFKTLKNTITISKGQIQIPEMAISSNVLNLNLSGSHSFENNIDYVVKLRLGDMLFAKRDKNSANKEFEEHLEIAKRDDDHRIPIHISGTVDDPQIGISSESLSGSLKESLKKQGQEIKDLFKKKDQEADKNTGLKFEWDEG